MEPRGRTIATIFLANLLAAGLAVAEGSVCNPGPDVRKVSWAERSTTFFFEDFTLGLGAWTVVSNGSATGPAGTWTTDNPGSRQLPLSEPFAIVDSDTAGFGEMDEELISPPIQTSLVTGLSLRFDHSFEWYSGGWDEVAKVDVRSSASDNQWITVAIFSGGSTSGTVSLDIEAFAGNDLQIRFHYSNANWEYWWAVDNVEVFGVLPFIFEDNFESGDTGHWSSTLP